MFFGYYTTTYTYCTSSFAFFSSLVRTIAPRLLPQKTKKKKETRDSPNCLTNGLIKQTNWSLGGRVYYSCTSGSAVYTSTSPTAAAASSSHSFSFYITLLFTCFCSMFQSSTLFRKSNEDERTRSRCARDPSAWFRAGGLRPPWMFSSKCHQLNRNMLVQSIS